MIDLGELLRHLTSGDDERAESAAMALASAGEAALPALVALLASNEADERWWAVRTLAAMPEPKIDLLANALRDGAAEVRAAAALGLATHPAVEVVPDLVRGLEDDDSLVSALCADALVSVGAPCVAALLEAFAESGQRGRIQIMRALAAIKDPTAIGVMLKATEDASAMLNYWAREGLEALGLDMVYLMPE